MTLIQSLAKRGNKNPMFGKKHTKETKHKMSLKSKGREVNEKWRKKISQRLKGKYIGSKSPRWKGGRIIKRIIKDGRTIAGDGYILIYKPDHPFHNNVGYVREHRLVLEQYLGRYLKPRERIHHINRIKNDNRLNNLIGFVNFSAHMRFHWNSDNIKPKEIIFDGRKINA